MPLDNSTFTLTDKLLEAGASQHGNWTAAQLRVLGISWPPPKGWKNALVGKPILQTDYRLFLHLKAGRGRREVPRGHPSLFDLKPTRSAEDPG